MVIKLLKIEEENNSFPILRVNGNYFEIGLKIGQKFKERIKNVLQESMQFREFKENDEKHPERLNNVESLAKKYFPNYMQEIKGISEGSNLEYRDILLLNFKKVPPTNHPTENCSTIIFKNPEKIILAHNEDYERTTGSYSYLLFVKLENGTKFFSHSYPGRLPGSSFGFNSHGIVYSMNSMTNPVDKIGFSCYLIGRSVLEANDIDDAIHVLTMHSPRFGGSSYNIASLKEKRAINIELTTDDAYITEITDRYFHTNHHVSEKFKEFPIPKLSTSVSRYNRGSKLMPHVKKSEEEAINILRDKYVFVNSLKGTDGNYTDTICSVIFNISKTITLSIYPHDLEKNRIQKFSQKDLNF